MRIRFLSLSFALAGLLLVGCSDSSDSRPGGGTPPPDPEPEISLDETGIYDGTLELDNGDVALMRLKLARDGTTVITLDTDDDENPDVVLWGESEGGDGDIRFTGFDATGGENVTIDLQITEGTASGRLDLSSLPGEFSLPLDEIGAGGGSLDRIAGEYARTSNLDGVSQLSIAADGAVKLEGTCEAEGTASQIDTEVNLYRITMESECLNLDALLSLEEVETEGDIVSIDGDIEQGGLALDFYRI
jgi:hypothetical protein